MRTKKRFNLGFTLVEILVTVAIMVSLFAVGGVAVSSIKRNLKQTKADATARAIFVAAQENLTKLTNSGKTDLDEGKSGVNSLGAYKPYGYEGENTIQYVTSETKNNGAGSLLLPKGTIDNAEYDNTWIIEYDPISGIVIGVFYNDTPNNEGFYKDASDDVKDTLRQDKNERKNYFDDSFIGYYGDGNGLKNIHNFNEENDKFSVKISVTNNDTLALNYSVSLDSEKYSSVNKVNFHISYLGNTSGRKVEKTINEIDLINYSASYQDVLDTLVDNDGVKDFSSSESDFVKAGFLPGENVTAEFVVTFGEIRSYEETVVFNSLFRACEESSTYGHIAKINCTRHLRNLGNLPDTFVVGQAIQESNIVVPAGTNFNPIVNDSLISYKGNSKKISNLIVTASNQDVGAGLFGVFGTKGKSEIRDVYLVDTRVVGSTYSGALAGIVGNGETVEISNVGVYLTINKTSDSPSTYISRNNAAGIIGNNAAGLVGKASDQVVIKNCFVATIVQGTNSAAGLVADANVLSVYNSYADCYLSADTVAGLIGVNKDNASEKITLETCYAAGTTFLSPKTVYGLASGNIDSATSVYTIFDITKASEAAFNLANSINKAVSVKYVENTSTLAAEVNQPNIGKVQIDSLTNPSDLTTNLGAGNFTFVKNNKTVNHPYNFEGLSLETYPFPEISGMPHYGDWLVDDGKNDKVGFFYWEKEVYDDNDDDDTNNKFCDYNYYLVYANKTTKNELPNDHDTGTHITEYGYGYITKNTADVKVTWDEKSVPVKNNKLDCDINTDVVNDIVSELNLSGIYSAYAYTTMNAFDDADNESAKGYLYVDNSKSALSRTFTTVTAVVDKTKTVYFSFCPYFAADIVVGNWSEYDKVYNPLLKAGYPHQIRSIEQLQYLNWNSLTRNNATLCGLTNYLTFPFLNSYSLTQVTSVVNNDYSVYEQTFDFECTHVKEKRDSKGKIIRYGYTPIAAQGTFMNNDSHTDIDTAIKSEIVDTAIKESNLYIFDWFASEYLGNTYKINNLNITSNAYTVGLFGTTTGARIDGVIMTSNNGSVIERKETHCEKCGAEINHNDEKCEKCQTNILKNKFISDYFIGGIVGLCNDSTLDLTSRLNNCAIGGYTIKDYSHQPTTLRGGSAVGGLVGASTIKITNCSAVVDIQIKSTSTYGQTAVGGLVGSASGSNIDPTKLTIVKTFVRLLGNFTDTSSLDRLINGLASVANCYTGGSIEFDSNTKNCGKYSKLVDGFKSYFVGGIVGNNKNTNVENIYKYDNAWNHSLSIYNCYTYMDLPKYSIDDNIESIGVIFSSSVTRLDDVIYNKYFKYNPSLVGGNNGVWNICYNCYYYANGVSYTVDDNFIEKEDYLSQAVKKALYTDQLYCIYTSNALGNGTGVKPCSFNTMVKERSGYMSTLNYCPDSKDGGYLFGTVITRKVNNQIIDRIHVGKYFDASKVTLSSGVLNKDDITLYIAQGENVSNSIDGVEKYLSNRLSNGNLAVEHNIQNAYHFGYFEGNNLMVTGDGKFVRKDSSNNITYPQVDANGIWQLNNADVIYTGKFGIHFILKSKYSHNSNAEIKNGYYTQDAYGYYISEDKKIGNVTFVTPNCPSNYTLNGWYKVTSNNRTLGISSDNSCNSTICTPDQYGDCTLYAGWKVNMPAMYKEISNFERNSSGSYITSNKYLIVHKEGNKYYRLVDSGSDRETVKLSAYNDKRQTIRPTKAETVTVSEATDMQGNSYRYITPNNYDEWKINSSGQLLYHDNYYLSYYADGYKFGKIGDGYGAVMKVTGYALRNVNIAGNILSGYIGSSDKIAYLTYDAIYQLDMTKDSTSNYIADVILFKYIVNDTQYIYDK